MMAQSAKWMPWLLLTVAIFTVVLATSSLKATDGFTRLWPSIGAACKASVTSSSSRRHQGGG